MTASRRRRGQRPSRRPELARPKSEVERLEEKLRRARAQRDANHGRAESLKQRVRELEGRRGWVEGYVGFRVEYRVRGAWRRWRRWMRLLRGKARLA